MCLATIFPGPIFNRLLLLPSPFWSIFRKWSNLMEDTGTLIRVQLPNFYHQDIANSELCQKHDAECRWELLWDVTVCAVLCILFFWLSKTGRTFLLHLNYSFTVVSCDRFFCQVHFFFPFFVLSYNKNANNQHALPNANKQSLNGVKYVTNPLIAKHDFI